MENLLKPETLIPILLNLILATTAVGFFWKGRLLRKAIYKQLEGARRGQLTSTTPFVYALAIEKAGEGDDLGIVLSNPTEHLARDVTYIVYESWKKTFRAPRRSNLLVRPGSEASVTLAPYPYTRSEIEILLKRFHSLNHMEKDLVSEGATSYVLLVYSDIEGRVYTVKAEFIQNPETGEYMRLSSRLKMVHNPKLRMEKNGR